MPTPLDEATILLKDIAHRPGAVLFSGVDTLVPGPLYVMGYNPGGATEVNELSGMGTIASSLEAVSNKENWNDWADGRYGPGGTYSPFQKNIRTVFEALGADPRRALSTNALFVRTPAASGIDGPWDLWWDTCWAVHQLFLDVVRPRVVVCLGNDGWEMLRQTHRRDGQGRYKSNFQAPGKDEAARHGKWRPDITLDLSSKKSPDRKTLTCSLLGLPHPSAQPDAKKGAYWPLSCEALAKVGEARAVAVGWEK